MNLSHINKILHELNPYSVFVRLFLATLFGAILGTDRALKRRAAGFRTHMLVCMGAALIMITNEFLQVQYATGDPARLGAQVISGIGFLGAGTIIVTRNNQVNGLTTAAGLWVSACLGLTVGVGFYSAALTGAFFVVFIVIVMQGIDQRLQKNSKALLLYIEFTTPNHLSMLLGYAAQNGMQIGEIEIVQARNDKEHIGAIIQIRLPERMEHQIITDQLRSLEGVAFLSQL